METQKKSSIFRFFPYTQGFRGRFLTAFLMVVVAVVANYMTPQVIRVTVDSVINERALQPPRAFWWGGSRAIGGRETLRQPHRPLRRGLPGLRGACRGWPTTPPA